MGQRTPSGQAAYEACLAHPDMPSKTLARMLHKQQPKMFPTLSRAYGAVRSYRGNKGERARREITARLAFRPNGKAGMILMPEPVQETWDQFTIAGPARILVLSDIHVPYHDPVALNAAVAYGKKQKPTHVLINGDGIDFYQLSRFDKDPTRRDAIQELRDFAQMLLWLRQQFPKAEHVYKLGNHDDRFDRYVFMAAPALAGLPQFRLDAAVSWAIGEITGKGGTLAERGWHYVADQRPVMAGKLPILHGHELPKGMASPVNMARGAYLRTSHTVLVGHGHRTSHHSEPDMFGKEVACWSTGCLCGRSPQYARINKWNAGFAHVDVAADGQFEVVNLRIVNGVVRQS